jgi:hypothetical protein
MLNFSQLLTAVTTMKDRHREIIVEKEICFKSYNKRFSIPNRDYYSMYLIIHSYAVFLSPHILAYTMSLQITRVSYQNSS